MEGYDRVIYVYLLRVVALRQSDWIALASSKLQLLNSLRWPVFVINSVWLPRRGECPTLLRQAGGLHFYWISGTQESGDYYRRGGVGGGWVNLPDPHIRFCNIPHWLLNCSSFFPLQTQYTCYSQKPEMSAGTTSVLLQYCDCSLIKW